MATLMPPPAQETNRGTRAGVGRLAGRRAGMVTFSGFPEDPRPRRALEALLDEGMSVDLICLAEAHPAGLERRDQLTIRRIPLEHTRGGFVQYAYNYLAFILISAFHLAVGLRRGRYDLVHIHNMPDVLVFSAIVPKLFGARVILDQHDPMPELMTTIFGFQESSLPVAVMKLFERMSLAFADAVVTVNIACQRIFSSRGCPTEKISVVMNTPDEKIFPVTPATGANPDAERRFVVMYHGSIVERNGLDLAVEALALLGDLRPRIELRVYGKDNSFLRQVMARAEERGVADCLSFRGPKRVDDLPAEIRQCDLGVIPNQKNAFTDINTPTRIFEYLAMGKPVIAPRTQGITDYFDAGSLFFFEPGDAKDLAETLRRAILDPAARGQLAEHGQQIFARHTWSKEREVLMGLVERLLPAPRPGIGSQK